PNDVVVKSDGTVWFTDPPFGANSNYEGNKVPVELGQNVYRLDLSAGQLTVVADDILGPNGLAFSPDESVLYVVESRGQPHRKILAYDLEPDGARITGKRVLIDAGPSGTPDGFRVDEAGNLWCGWGLGTAELDGVRIFSPNGTAIGHISLPERCANVCFGGPRRNRLFMAAAQSLYAVYTNVQGVRGG
ncbi:MAG: SMP-30/gluconolactonase/LRE family protein, partial [Pseudomonadota bacterium]